MVKEPKETLVNYLREAREALVGKLDGVSERDARWPRTPTGTNLIGIIKHCANVEAVYFGTTFGRAFPGEGLVKPHEYEANPQTDCYASEHESVAGILDLYRAVQAFADDTIAGLELDSIGRVPHWRGAEVTLHQIFVHTLTDLTRHAGHADILREQIDGVAGMRNPGDNMPDGVDWPAYVAKLQALADS